MEELVDGKSQMKEKRGGTIPVLTILSWIYMGLWFLWAGASVSGGKMSEEELAEEKVELLSSLDADMPGAEVWIAHAVEFLEVWNENHMMLGLAQLGIILIGFFAVLMIYRLKKIGFYIYCLYSVAPTVLFFSIFPGNKIINSLAIIFGIFTVLFLILYGTQLKRME